LRRITGEDCTEVDDAEILAIYSPDGELSSDQQYALERLPDFMHKYTQVSSMSLLYTEGGTSTATLPAKYRELIVAVILTAHRASHEGIVAHLRRAFDLGLTEREALDAYVAAQMPGGSSTFWGGIRAVRAAIALPRP
jgi:alkylhydroperoxidase/carboxymuconolactone decarboxylase family protein YurZ